MSNNLYLTLDEVETEALQHLIRHCSDATWIDKPTRKALIKFKEHVLHAIESQGAYDAKLEYGDFS
jgi:hypothetical protein